MGIDNILSFLDSQQQPNGSFLNQAGNKDFTSSTILHTTFTTSLILGCLKNLKTNKIAQTIIKRGLHFLEKEKDADWSWNYWQKNSSEIKLHPYPNDWDDTACALIACNLYRPEMITPEALGLIIKKLVQTEIKPGGPYNTWMTKNQKWENIDPVVNANIAYFLKQQNVKLQNLDDYFDHIITTHNYNSHYYLSPIAVIYFINRGYDGTLVKNYCDYLLKVKNDQGIWGGMTDTALAVSVLLSRQYKIEHLKPAINYLLGISKESLSTEPFYIESKKDGVITYSGSTTLTAAFMLEALTTQKMLNYSRQKEKQKDKIAHMIHAAIMTKTKKYLSFFGPNVEKKVMSLFERILKNNPKQRITLLPYYFYQSLYKKPPINNKLLINLGQANLYGWLAYTMYDDIMDDDSDTLLLPVANVCLRELTGFYMKIMEPSLYSFFKNIMNKMEKTNFEEKRQYHIFDSKIDVATLPTYPINYRADKSLAHALGPITLLYQCGYKLKSNEIQTLISFFQNYLHARQLNDDAHDWLLDLEKKFLNSVSLSLLKNYARRHQLTIIDIAAAKQELQNYFWKYEIIKVSNIVNSYVTRARNNLKKLTDIMDISYYQSLLVPLQTGSDIIRKEKNVIERFYTTFTS